MKKAVSIAALMIALGGAPLSASADDTPNGERPSLVIQLPVFDIQGTRQQPGAQYILTRTGSRYQVEDLRESFIPELIHSVQGDAFE
ncbi:MAG: hypothetical protein AAGF12_21370 [Myxococcota bacterium]